ncbi:hypothetical protein JAAARDRAFT_119492 [Jaapia argillacea MUCL 33604]|uniref:RNA helicase n=1 Tax=Jaapia argillacea MUCL 33604 TaxID=933084 RepID=A0A067QA99_9AGAM|nr:hypothetical protein JAAARDRAFT_119492 [Jaapia argillacea MUCL 33604]
MPPKRGIVKSGNAGNSAKSSKVSETAPVPTDGPKALFPPGYKYPLSLLSERCQKNGWEKPHVDTVSRECRSSSPTQLQRDGYSFVVTLGRLNKKTSEIDHVRLEPHPPKLMPTPLEARHWGATYALYRFCNGMQLNMQLPPGPRDYWVELATEHKSVPEHQRWMYDADPFAARKAVEERQVKATKKEEERTQAAEETRRGTRVSPVSPMFANAPEVKMASSLRDLVEESVKKAIALHPEAGDGSPSIISPEDAIIVLQQLGHLGFTSHQSRAAVSFLSTPSQLASTLLQTLSALEASIEYLILHVPECDLPQRFLPSNNSSASFITSAHGGSEALKKRWLEDKAVKEAGWPIHSVKDCAAQAESEDWGSLITMLNQKLLGEEWVMPAEWDVVQLVDDEELEAIGASYVDSTEILITPFTAPLKLHILIPRGGSYSPQTYPPPMYVTSNTIPAYVRLHLLSKLLRAIRIDELVQPGEEFFLAAMQLLEEEWAQIGDNGPPDMSAVLQYLLPRRKVEPELPPELLDGPTPGSGAKGNGRKRRAQRVDRRSDAQVREEFEQVCKMDKFLELYTTRKKLPAFASKDEFLAMLEKSRVVVVVGETGSGKTTQLPQFILDSLILSNSGSKASILVTQPRRISALSVAARVSSERLDDGSVGYAIRGESRQDARTKLMFCTTGVVLRRLSTGDDLRGVTHVVVDEVHERSVDGDFLLLELKELLAKHRTLKVVLMSATINHETFVKYFDSAPLLTIPGLTHPVTDIYLEDVLPLISYRPPSTKSTKKETEAEQQAFREEFKSRGLGDDDIRAIQNIGRSERIDFQLITSVVAHIVSTAQKRGGILVFLPGVQEIRQCIDALRAKFSRSEADIFPLHANLSNDEQKLVFRPTSRWKIVVATNVAETSITIDDIIYVVDAGRVKETQYDVESSLSRLVETWVNRAGARQRRGRAGRTQPGVCYKLYTRRQEAAFAAFPVPEILRVGLESICLTVKAMREKEDVKRFLSKAIDPPSIVAMDKAWSVLEDLGAIDEDGGLTALGRHIAMLPIDLRLAKMLVLATIFRCLGPVLDVVACLSSKPLFFSPMDKREEAMQARLRFATENSDLLTDVRAFNECIRLRKDGKPQSAVRDFCQQNFISLQAVREVTTLRQDFLSSLSEIGFIPFGSEPSDPSLNVNSDNSNLVKAVILGGLWPRVARVSLPKSAIKFDRVQAGTVQRENLAKEYKIYDLAEGRVFLHPVSVLFGATTWKSPFLAYFQKQLTSKLFLRDATEVPLYALLLFGGPVTVNHIAGGLTVGGKDTMIKLRAWPRIGILVNQLRRLLDEQLQRCIEEGTTLDAGKDSPVLHAMLALLTGDGLSSGNL